MHTKLMLTRCTAVLVTALLWLMAGTQALATTTWHIGDVFAGVADGQYKVYSNAGVYKETISDGLGGYTTGCSFNPALDKLYTTNFTSNRVVVYNDPSPHAIAQTIITTGKSFPESIVFAADGRFFVGGPFEPVILEYNASGTLIATHTVSGAAGGGTGGPDWIDLSANQMTMFYTTEGRIVKRFDVAADVQLADFATLPDAGNAYALRLLTPGDGSGGLLVADGSNVKRLDGSGAVVQTYDVDGEDSWFSLNLDPNGTSFWAGDFGTANFYRLNIASGAVEIGPINTGTGTYTLFGICLKGEITAALGNIVLTPTTAQNQAGTSHKVTATVTSAGNPAPGELVGFSVTAGPNTGQVSDPNTGECTANSDCTTDSNGQVSWTYTSDGTAGTDTIQACFDDAGTTKCATASKQWTGAGPPATLTLTPATATNTAGTEHCVTATVRDANGTPTPNITVNFSVSGPNGPLAGSAVTDANGEARFCYTGTHAGTDTITARAVGGSNPSATARKTWQPGKPASLVLTPATDTNPVDAQHCVTATVTDQFANPTPNITVRFSVSPTTFRTPSSGTAVTDGNGQATFCYTSALPGNDIITAYADTNNNGVQDPGEPSGTASKTWGLPESTAGCMVTDGGRIIAANGDKATFGSIATVAADGTSSGAQQYQDHGSAADLNVHSTAVLAVTCSADGKKASVFGTATINGTGSFDYRIDLTDNTEPGVGTDKYRIRLSTGYDSGEQTLVGGNIQLH
jgi:hypothetical protein